MKGEPLPPTSIPGKLVDEALTKVGRAHGRITLMTVKRKLLREQLNEALSEIEEAARLIKEALRLSSTAS